MWRAWRAASVGVVVLGVGAGAMVSTATASQKRPGMGSPVSSWVHSYGHARGPGAVCSAKNSCFGVSVRNAASGRTFAFVNVGVTDGIVSGFTAQFPNHTPLATVEAELGPMLGMTGPFPPVTVDHVGGSCGIINLTLPALGSTKRLGNPKIGDPAGTIGIVLDSINATLTPFYKANNIQTALVSVASVAPTESC